MKKALQGIPCKNEDIMPPSSEDAPKPNLQVAARVEELLREQLEERGVNPRRLTPEDIVANMTCHIAPDNSMTYLWKNEPILHITPEKHEQNGESSVLWRMFTRDDMPFSGSSEVSHEHS